MKSDKQMATEFRNASARQLNYYKVSLCHSIMERGLPNEIKFYEEQIREYELKLKAFELLLTEMEGNA